jgi:hypothetical protein
MSNTSFSALKKNRTSNISRLAAELDKMNSKKPQGDSDDGRFWQPTADKAGNGSAIIRFLPAPKGEDLPYARYWYHGFQGPTGSYYIENCLTTIGGKCPACDDNNRLWNSGDDKNKKIVSQRKRRLTFVSNIQVIKDPANPENDGKVFLFKYGKKIFDKISDTIVPPEDELDPTEPVDVFDFWEGAPFKLRFRKVEGYRNYEKSEFGDPCPIADSDEEIEAIWNQQHSLTEFTDPSKFKSRDVLLANLAKALGTGDVSEHADDVQLPESQPEVQSKPAKKAPAKKAPAASKEDDDLEFDDIFKKLNEE